MPDKSMADDAKERRKSKVEQLRDKRDKLNSQIRQLEAHEVNKRRREENRRKVLIGSAILARVKNKKEGWDDDRLLAMMDNFLIRPKERELFGLDPLPASSPRLQTAQTEKSKKNGKTGPEDVVGTSDSNGMPDVVAIEKKTTGEQAVTNNKHHRTASPALTNPTSSSEEFTRPASLTESTSAINNHSEDGIGYHDARQNAEHVATIAIHGLDEHQPKKEDRPAESKNPHNGQTKQYRPRPPKRLPESDDEDELEKEFNL